MYYINGTPNEAGNYGNPMGQVFPGALALPERLLEDYLQSMGFVFLETDAEDELLVTEVRCNRAAFSAYLAEHPAVEAEQEAPEPTPEELLNILLGVSGDE